MDSIARAHGIDLSFWQTALERAENPPRPVDFVIQKLTEAVYKDAACDALKERIGWVPVRGGYHYLTGPARGSWKSQADIFLTYLTDEYHFWALDAEKKGNYESQIFDKPVAGFVESILPFMEYVRRNTSKPGLLYTNPDMWGTWLAPYQSDLAKYDLWIAHYWYKPNPEGTPNYYTVRGAETMRCDWRFWQYDKNGQGGRGREYGVQSDGLDLNVFNGSVEDLRAWARLEQPETEAALTLESLERRVKRLEEAVL